METFPWKWNISNSHCYKVFWMVAPLHQRLAIKKSLQWHCIVIKNLLEHQFTSVMNYVAFLGDAYSICTSTQSFWCFREPLETAIHIFSGFCVLLVKASKCVLRINLVAFYDCFVHLYKKEKLVKYCDILNKIVKFCPPGLIRGGHGDVPPEYQFIVAKVKWLLI